MKRFSLYTLLTISMLIVNIGLSAASFNGADLKDNRVVYTAQDSVIFQKYVAYMADKRELPLNETIIATAKFFLGTPYVANTLEKEPESLVVNLRELDCTTFVETVFALSRTIKLDAPTFDNFCNNLRTIRYRGGVIEDYTSRLHYSTDWIYDNEQRGIMKDVTRAAGARRLKLDLYIMSKTPDTYKQLKGRPELAEKIKAKEREISARKHYYIKSRKIDRKSKRIEDGCMVGFVTTIPGIDLSHMAIVYHVDGKLTFIHASSSLKKVCINESTMGQFVKGSKRNTGIVLAKLQ